MPEPAGQSGEIAEGRHHPGHDRDAGGARERVRQEGLATQQPRRRHCREQRERHGREIGMHQQRQHLQQPRSGPERAGRIADQPEVKAEAGEQQEMPAQRRMPEAPDPGRHRGRGERDAERRQQARLTRATQGPNGRHRLQHPGQPVEQPDPVEPLREQLADRLQRQRHRRDRVGEGGVQPAFLGVQVRREGGRPAPGIGDEVALRDDVLRRIAHRPPRPPRLRQEELLREYGDGQRQPQREGARIGKEAGAGQAADPRGSVSPPLTVDRPPRPATREAGRSVRCRPSRRSRVRAPGGFREPRQRDPRPNDREPHWTGPPARPDAKGEGATGP